MAIDNRLDPMYSETIKRESARSKRRARIRSGIGRTLLYAVILLLALLFVLPFVWMVSTSLKDDPQTYHIPPIWIPIPARWANYPEVLMFLPFGLFLRNTLIIAIPSVIGGTFTSAMAAYGLSRIRWPGRDLVFAITIATMMIPFQVQMVPLFLTFKQLGWLNTFLPLIVPALGGAPYFIFLLRQFFMGIPQEISDAARVDGCTDFGIFFRIILPLARPALAVVALFIFMWAWNDYIGPLIYLNDQSKFTLALGLQLLRTTSLSIMRLAWPYLMAASTMTILPILIVFFFVQRTFIEGISLTGVKG